MLPLVINCSWVMRSAPSQATTWLSGCRSFLHLVTGEKEVRVQWCKDKIGSGLEKVWIRVRLLGWRLGVGSFQSQHPHSTGFYCWGNRQVISNKKELVFEAFLTSCFQPRPEFYMISGIGSRIYLLFNVSCES